MIFTFILFYFFANRALHSHYWKDDMQIILKAAYLGFQAGVRVSKINYYIKMKWRI